MTRQEHIRDAVVEIKKYLKQMNLGTSPGSTSLNGNVSGLAKESTLQSLTSIIGPMSGNVASIDILTSSIQGLVSSLNSEVASQSGTLGNLDVKQGLILSQLTLQNWNYTTGNSQIISYYAAGAPGNPTTSVSNVSTIEYYSSATLKFTQTFTYNTNGDVISITVT